MKNRITSLSYVRLSHRIGLFLLLGFVIDFIWHSFINPVDPSLVLQWYRIAYLGFNEMNVVGFILGAVQTYLWAYIGVGLWRAVEKVS